MVFDICFGILLLLGVLRGFRQGLAFQMVQLAGLIFGILFAEPLAERLAPALANQLPTMPEELHAPVFYFGSMLTIAVVIWIGGITSLVWYRKSAFGENKPSLGDRVFGVGPGALKAAFIVCLLVYVMENGPARPIVEKFDYLETQYADSRAVQLSNEYHIIDRLIDTPEIKQARGNLGLLVHHYRSQQASPQNANTPGPNLK